MLLQAAIDGASKGRTLEEALAFARTVQNNVDIIEVGTTFILRYGMESVRQMKKTVSNCLVLADMKLMDGGGPSTRMACESGADIVTVLGVSDLSTIEICIREAHACGKKLMVDMMCVKDLETRIREVEELGADYVCVHIGVDMQLSGESPVEALKLAKRTVSRAGVAVAGGINLQSAPKIAEYRPDIMIVGNGLQTEDPAGTAAQIQLIMGD